MDLFCELYLTVKGIKPGCVVKTRDPEALLRRFNLPVIPYALGTDIAFISSQRERVEALQSHPARNIHELVGWFCGYPECCVREFLRYNALIPALKAYKRKGQDPYRLSVDSESVRSPYHINWIPCSPGCTETMKLVKLYQAECTCGGERFG
jgi:hypothetical protein